MFLPSHVKFTDRPVSWVDLFALLHASREPREQVTLVFALSLSLSQSRIVWSIRITCWFISFAVLTISLLAPCNRITHVNVCVTSHQCECACHLHLITTHRFIFPLSLLFMHPHTTRGCLQFVINYSINLKRDARFRTNFSLFQVEWKWSRQKR